MSDASFANALKKGKDLYQKIRDAEARSPAYGYNDLTKYSWAVNSYSRKHLSTEMKKAMEALGVSSVDSENKNIYASHIRSFRNKEGEKTDVTGGMYFNTYKVSGGAIIADDNHSPTHMVNYDSKTKTKKVNPLTGEELKRRLPEVHHYSDVVWATWDHYAKEEAHKLRFIFRGKITNQETRRIMKQAMGLSESDVLKLAWPGKKFDMSTDKGKALLGTGHGSSVAYLLITGKYKLGEKKPVVSIFTDDDNDYFMVWELKDA